jgi:hypothetical protein
VLYTPHTRLEYAMGAVRAVIENRHMEQSLLETSPFPFCISLYVHFVGCDVVVAANPVWYTATDIDAPDLHLQLLAHVTLYYGRRRDHARLEVNELDVTMIAVQRALAANANACSST